LFSASAPTLVVLVIAFFLLKKKSASWYEYIIIQNWAMEKTRAKPAKSKLKKPSRFQVLVTLQPMWLV
jgi:hypothetical protein